MIVTRLNESYSVIDDNISKLQEMFEYLKVERPGAYMDPLVKAGFKSPYEYFGSIQHNKLLVLNGHLELLKSFGVQTVIQEPEFTRENIESFLVEIKNSLPFEPYDFQEKAFIESVLNYKQINKMCTGCLDGDSEINVNINGYTEKEILMMLKTNKKIEMHWKRKQSLLDLSDKLGVGLEKVILLEKLYLLKNKNNFYSKLNNLLHKRITHNIPLDFYDIKQSLFNMAIDNSKKQSAERYKNIYSYKWLHVFKKYNKSKTNKFKPIDCDNSSVAHYIKKYQDIYVAIAKYNERSKKLSYILSIQYYIDQGMSLEDAKLALKERQSTFSLKKCIKKYGHKKGICIFQERQEKWQNTLKSKPKEEIYEINRKKGQSNTRFGWPSDKHGRLYYVKFYNKDICFWKIGITTKTVQERFKIINNDTPYGLKCDILFEQNGNIYDCYNLEQKILETFNKERVTINYNNFKTTEAFSEDVLCEHKINV